MCCFQEKSKPLGWLGGLFGPNNDELATLFAKRVEVRRPAASASASTSPARPKTPSSPSSTATGGEKVAEVKNIMEENKRKLMERGDHINDVRNACLLPCVFCDLKSSLTGRREGHAARRSKQRIRPQHCKTEGEERKVVVLMKLKKICKMEVSLFGKEFVESVLGADNPETAAAIAALGNKTKEEIFKV